MINLETKKTGYSCFDQILASIIAFFEASDCYPMMFSNCWGFGFDNTKTQSSIIGDKIRQELNSRDLLFETTGIKLQHHRLEDINHFLNILENETNKERPVVGRIDSYYSPWDNHYHKVHGPHSLIFLGIDRTKEIIYCGDRYYSPRIEYLPINLLNKVCRSYITFDLVKKLNPMDETDCTELIISSLNEMFALDVFGNIKEFAEYAEKHLDMIKEISGYSVPEMAPLIVSLNSIGYGRECFSRALDYIKIKYRKYELDYFIDTLQEIVGKWRNIVMILCKYAVVRTKKLDTHQISKRLNDIADAEKKTALELLKFLQEGNIISKEPTIRKWDNSFQANNFVQVDITSYMNERAFAGEIENNVKANYHGTEEYFVMKNPIENNSVIYGNARFKLKFDDFGFPYDNFTCNEQIIEPKKDYYADLLIVVSAVFSHQEAKVTIVYEDNSNDVLEFNVSDWRSENIFGEYIIYESYSAKKVNELKNMLQGNAYLYLQRIKVSAEKRIEKAILPFHPDIHIFAIGFCKA